MPNTDSYSLTRSPKAAVVSKVIDITPGIDFHPRKESTPLSAKAVAAKLLTFSQRHRFALAAAAAILFAALIVTLALSHGAHRVNTATSPAAQPAAPFRPAVIPAQKIPPAAPLLVELNLSSALQQGLVACQWRGNGKDRLFMDARSNSAQPLRLHLDAGQLLASDDSTIVIVKSQTLDFAPHAALHEEFPTAATSSGNHVIGAEFHLSSGALPDLDKLFAYVAAHPEASASAIQTATLILTENLPLSAFARFNELSAGPGAIQESQDFKATTVDILTALTIVKDIGIDRPLAVTIDPQLEVEAMIDPSSHSLAIQYYGITDEWAFWKNQLLQGDPTTRHYALYGIARYYPNVALEMLPKWARGETISPVFRMSAVQALAQTGRPEAIPILRELERELGATTDLGHAAHVGANFLDAQFSGSASADTEPRRPSLASAGN